MIDKSFRISIFPGNFSTLPRESNLPNFGEKTEQILITPPVISPTLYLIEIGLLT